MFMLFIFTFFFIELNKELKFNSLYRDDELSITFHDQVDL